MSLSKEEKGTESVRFSKNCEHFQNVLVHLYTKAGEEIGDILFLGLYALVLLVWSTSDQTELCVVHKLK